MPSTWNETDRSCGTCLCFDRFERPADTSGRPAASGRGLCRLDPPLRLPREFAPEASAGSRVRKEDIRWGWPEVEEADYCVSGFTRRTK